MMMRMTNPVMMTMIGEILEKHIQGGIIQLILAKIVGTNFIKPSWLVIIIFFLDYLPGVFLIYLSMKEIDCLTHFLDLGNLE